MRELERFRERMSVYHYHALAIQGAFRGYQSRKYNYNHARRKGYLQEVRTLSSSLFLPRSDRTGHAALSTIPGQARMQLWPRLKHK